MSSQHWKGPDRSEPPPDGDGQEEIRAPGGNPEAAPAGLLPLYGPERALSACVGVGVRGARRGFGRSAGGPWVVSERPAGLQC